MTAPSPDQTRRRNIELEARSAAQRGHRYKLTHDRPDPALNGSGVHRLGAVCSCGERHVQASTGSAAEAQASLEVWIGQHVEHAAAAAASAALSAFDAGLS